MSGQERGMRVAVIYTGGTIGAMGRPLIPISGAAFAERWGRAVAPLLPEDVEVDWREFSPSLDSSQLQPSDWTRIARLTLQAAIDGVDGVLVLHGTDTMASSAAALAYLTTALDEAGHPIGRLGIPVVFTGSQLPLFAEDGELMEESDALDNLLDSFEEIRERRPGTWLVTVGDSLPGARTIKVSTREPAAFAAPNGFGRCAPLPAADPAQLLQALDVIAPELGRKAVIAIGPTPNPPAALGAALAGAVSALSNQLGAIQLLGYGVGNLPAAQQLSPIIKAARSRGVVVAIGTQVVAGGVSPDTYRAGHWLTEAGAVPSGDMTIPAAQAKLHITIALTAARGWSLDEAEAFFRRPLAGEISV